MGSAAVSTSPFRFFVLVFALAAPLYAVDELNSAQIVRGVPLAGLGVVCPVLAAVILLWRDRGWSGAAQLLKRSWDFRRVTAKSWYLPALLVNPVVVAASYVMLRVTGHDIPNPRITVGSMVLLAIGFFIGGLGEELGWSGYVTEPLRNRWGALRAGLVIGAMCAVWHWIPLLQVHRSVGWIAWWSLYTIAARVIMVWVFANTGHSVFAVTLFHASLNLSWQLYPVNGSYFDQPLVAVLMAAVAVVVAAVWGPRTLADPRGLRRRVGKVGVPEER